MTGDRAAAAGGRVGESMTIKQSRGAYGGWGDKVVLSEIGSNNINLCIILKTIPQR